MNNKDKSYFVKLILAIVAFVIFFVLWASIMQIVKNKRAVNPQSQVSVSPEPANYIKDEIKIGKVEIDYNAIEQTQKLVDSGKQPWQLNPIMFLASELTLYGFDEKDYDTLSNIPSVEDQAKFGADITNVKMDMTHNDKIYTITLIQPVAGIGKIWTISEIEVKQKDEFSDWKTYRNDRYGFEIKYPKNLYLTLTENEISLFSTPFICNAEGVEGKEEVNDIKIIFNQKMGSNYAQIWKDVFRFDFNKDAYDGSKIIGGKKAYFYSLTAEMVMPYTTYLVEKTQNEAIEIKAYELVRPMLDNCTPDLGGDGDDLTGNETINKILSTFKFINDKNVINKIKNSEHFSQVFKRTIKLKDGKYFYIEPRSVSDLKIGIYNDMIALSDINDDGEKYAAIILESSNGGSGHFYELEIMRYENNNYVYLASEYLGDRVEIYSVKIENKTIIIDMLDHDINNPNDALCCPTLKKLARYKLSNY